MLNQRKVNGEIPTSSMADVAFLLVIYFMLTLTFATSSGLDYQNPPVDETPIEIAPEEAVYVRVERGGSLTVDGRQVALTGLLDYLAPRLAQNPLKPVILHPQPDAEYGYMVEVYDVLRQGPARLGLDQEIRVSVPTAREAEGWPW